MQRGDVPVEDEGENEHEVVIVISEPLVGNGEEVVDHGN